MRRYIEEIATIKRQNVILDLSEKPLRRLKLAEDLKESFITIIIDRSISRVSHSGLVAYSELKVFAFRRGA